MISPRTIPRPQTGLASSSNLVPPSGSRLRPPAAPIAPSLKPNLIEFVKAARHRWIAALATALGLAFVTSTVAWPLIPAPTLKYQATALVTMDLKPPVVLASEPWSGNDYPSYRRTQIDLLKSRAILAPAVHRPEVIDFLTAHGQDPEKVIRSTMASLKIDFGVPEWPSQLLKLTLQGEDAEQTVVLINAIQETFLERTIEDAKRQQVSRLASLNQSYERARTELESKRQSYLKAAGESGPVSLEEEQLAAMQLAEYQKELSRLEMAKLKAQSRGKTHVAMKPPAVTPEMLDRWVEKDHRVGELRKRIEGLRDELQKIRSIAVQPETLEEYRQLVELTRIAQDALKRRQTDIRPLIEQRLEKIARDSMVEEEDNEPDERTLAPEAALLAERTRSQSQKVRDLGEKRRRFDLAQAEQLQSAKAEVDGLDTAARTIKEKIDLLELERKAPPRVRGVGDVAAEPANENESGNRLRIAGLAALLTGAFTIVGFGWWEFQGQRIHSAGDIASQLGIRVIGTLPSLAGWRLPGPKLHRAAADLAARDRMQDSVDSVGTLLAHEMNAANARVLLVTSALEHEGKTTLAADLAASFARNGRKTLLIDSDLVRPSLHQRFGFPLVPGLSEALWNQTAPDAGIRGLPEPNLFLLSAGHAGPQVMQALGRDAMEPLLKHFRDEFEMIVIDSSPVLPLAHAMRISKHVDAAVLTIMNNQSILPAVSAAYQRLLALEVHVLGAVFIGPQVGDAVSSYSTKSWKLLRA
ncbi:MAG TPA: hypothetical protein VGP68_03560 [Gemmataceae bacterium]|nr:hypothetical protein [Gemmataceae bacterium]